MKSPEDEYIDELKAALDAIINGTMLDKHNHNDDGLIDFSQGREIGYRDIKRWIAIGNKVLNKYK